MSYAETRFQQLTNSWLGSMRLVRCSKAEFIEGLRAALEELEIEIQAAKETEED